jgi:asparagine synthase (glutamine-hydrolysing)
MSRYWNPVDAPDIRLASDEQYAQAFLDLFQVAIRARLRGAGAVGAHVTGGLDSSSIAVIAARELSRQGKRLTGFCWSPDPKDSAELCRQTADERRLIKAIGDQESFPVRFQKLSADDLVTVLRRNVMQRPTCNTLVHEQLVQSQAAAEGIDVILSGWGGDETIGFNGRGYLPELLISGRWLSLYRNCKLRSPNKWRYLLRRAVLPLAPAAVRDGIGVLRSPHAPVAEYFFGSAMRDLRSAAAPLLRRSWREVGLRKTQLQLLELGHLTHRIESWASSGARHNLEYRYPLLDHRLIDFAVGLPPEQYVRGAWTRYLMRRAVTGIVPEAVQWNRDKSDPARSQMLAGLMPAAYKKAGQYLADRPAAASCGYIDVERLVRRLASDEPIVGEESDDVWHILQFLEF